MKPRVRDIAIDENVFDVMQWISTSAGKRRLLFTIGCIILVTPISVLAGFGIYVILDCTTLLHVCPAVLSLRIFFAVWFAVVTVCDVGYCSWMWRVG